MSAPKILSDNLLEAYSTLAATDTDTGYDVLNVIDRKPYSFWQGANTTTRDKYITCDLGSGVTGTANCLGIYGHNLLTAGAQVAVEYSSNGSSWSTALAAFTVTSDKALMKAFTAQTARYWRVKITRASDFAAKPKAAIICVGESMDFQYPPDAPYIPASKKIDGKIIQSQSGIQLASRVTHLPLKITARFSANDKTWMEGTYWPWWRDYGRYLYPFFYGWDLTNYADTVYLVALDPASAYEDPRSRAAIIDMLNLQLTGIAEY